MVPQLEVVAAGASPNAANPTAAVDANALLLPLLLLLLLLLLVHLFQLP